MPAQEKETYSKSEVAELMETVFAKFAPILESIALTPEKLREATKPYKDPMELARENHMRKENQRSEMERHEGIKRSQSVCTHRDENGKFVIGLQHNYHDGLARGVCPRCNKVIEPAHWDWRPKLNEQTGDITAEAFVVPADPLYYIVQNIEAVGRKAASGV